MSRIHEDLESILSQSVLDKLDSLSDFSLDLAANKAIILDSEKNILAAQTICENPEVEIPDVLTQLNLVFSRKIQRDLFHSNKYIQYKSFILKHKRTCENNANEVNLLIKNVKKKMKEYFKPLNTFKGEIENRKKNLENTIKNLLVPFENNEIGINKIDSSKYSQQDKENFEKDKIEIDQVIKKFSKKCKDYSNKYSKMTNQYMGNINKYIDIFLKLAEPVKSLSDIITGCGNNFEEEIENLEDLKDIKEVLERIGKNINGFNINKIIDGLDEDLKKINNISENEIEDINKLIEEMNDSCSDLKKDSDNIEEKIKNIRKKYGEKEIKTQKLIIDVPVNKIDEIKKAVDNIIEGKEEIKEEIKKSQEEIKNIIEKLNDNFSVDLIIILDTTSDMFEYYDQIKKNILKVKDKIKENCFGVNLRIGFLGYKDYQDYDMDEKSYVNIPLTSDFDLLEKQIENIKIEGGDDIPEDLAWGLDKAKNQLCDLSKAATKYVILITDAPCHGGRYHDLGEYNRKTNRDGDRYIDGDINKINVDEIIKSMAINNVNFYCVKILDRTDKMFTIFEEIYNKNKTEKSSEFVIVKDESPEHLPLLITESINKIFQNRMEVNYENKN